MVDFQRSLVLDANVLVRAALGRQVRQLIDLYVGSVHLFAPQVAFDDAGRHLPTIAERRGLDGSILTDALDTLTDVVWPISQTTYERRRDDALKRIGARDPDDWHILAAALALDCPIWTHDLDFFGTGVPTWTSGTVEIYLAGSENP